MEEEFMKMKQENDHLKQNMHHFHNEMKQQMQQAVLQQVQQQVSMILAR